MLHKFDQKPQDQWIGIVDNSVDLVRLKIEGKIGELLLVKCIKNILSKWGQEEATLSCITGESTPKPSLASTREQSQTLQCLFSRDFHVFATGV